MKVSRKNRGHIVAGMKVASLILAGIFAAGASPGRAGVQSAGSGEVRTATFALG